MLLFSLMRVGLAGDLFIGDHSCGAVLRAGDDDKEGQESRMHTVVLRQEPFFCLQQLRE